MTKKFLLTLIFIGLIYSGCSQTDKSESASLVNPIGVFPIVNEPITIDVMVLDINDVSNWEENYYTKWLEEKTNIHVNFIPIPEENPIEQINLRIAADNIPDVIIGFPFESQTIQNYGTKGVFRPINDLIEKYGDEINHVFEEIPYAKGMVTSLDGNIYGLPKINECYHCSWYIKAWVYKPWLDKLGLSMPETTDDFYNMLKAFKENDPNGNGIADEIPLASANIDDWAHCNLDQFIMNAFVYNHRETRLYVDNKEVVFAPATNEWREGLRYIQKLFSEKLISPQSLFQDYGQYSEMGTAKPHIMGVGLSAYPGLFADYRSEGNGWDYYAIPPLKGPEGKKVAGWKPFMGIEESQLIITTKNKFPEATFRWADFMLSNESTMRATMGLPDINWKKAEPGVPAINGETAKWNIINYEEGEEGYDITNNTWGQRGPSMRTGTWRASWAAQPDSPRNGQEAYLYTSSRDNYAPYGPEITEIIPPLHFDENQSAELEEMKLKLLEYIDTATVKFITGTLDIEKDWETYLQELKFNNVDRYVTLYQDAYDIQKSRYFK